MRLFLDRKRGHFFDKKNSSPLFFFKEHPVVSVSLGMAKSKPKKKKTSSSRRKTSSKSHKPRPKPVSNTPHRNAKGVTCQRCKARVAGRQCRNSACGGGLFCFQHTQKSLLPNAGKAPVVTFGKVTASRVPAVVKGPVAASAWTPKVNPDYFVTQYKWFPQTPVYGGTPPKPQAQAQPQAQPRPPAVPQAQPQPVPPPQAAQASDTRPRGNSNAWNKPQGSMPSLPSPGTNFGAVFNPWGSIQPDPQPRSRSNSRAGLPPGITVIEQTGSRGGYTDNPVEHLRPNGRKRADSFTLSRPFYTQVKRSLDEDELQYEDVRERAKKTFFPRKPREIATSPQAPPPVSTQPRSRSNSNASAPPQPETWPFTGRPMAQSMPRPEMQEGEYGQPIALSPSNLELLKNISAPQNGFPKQLNVGEYHYWDDPIMVPDEVKAAIYTVIKPLMTEKAQLLRNWFFRNRIMKKLDGSGVILYIKDFEQEVDSGFEVYGYIPPMTRLSEVSIRMAEKGTVFPDNYHPEKKKRMLRYVAMINEFMIHYPGYTGEGSGYKYLVHDALPDLQDPANEMGVFDPLVWHLLDKGIIPAHALMGDV
jgi:hypothetical protein